MTTLVPIGRASDIQETRPLLVKPSDSAIKYCGLLVAAVALGGLGAANLVSHTANNKSFYLVAGIVLCGSSAILFTALVILGVKKCKKDNQPAIV